MNYLLISFGILSFIPIGLVLLRLFKTNFPFLEKLSVALLVGNFFVTFTFFYLYFFKIHLTKFYCLIIFIASLTYLIIISSKYLYHQVISFVLKTPNIKKNLPHIRFQEKILIGLIIFIIIYALIKIINQPVNTNDALSYWSYYSKIFFYEKTIYSDAFTDKFRVLRTKDYPFFLSLTEAYLFEIANKYDDKAIKLLFFFYYISFISIFYYRSKQFFPPAISLLITTLLFSLPSFLREDTGGISSAMADIPLTLFSTSSLLFFASFLLQKEKKYLILSSIFLASAIFIKNEGIIIFLSFIIAIFSSQLKNKIPLFLIITFLSFPIMVNLPWFYFKFLIAHPLYKIETIKLHPIQFLYVPIKIIFDNFVNVKLWGLIWLALPLSLLSFKLYKERIFLFLLIFMVSHWLFYIFIIMILPPPTHLAMPRFLLHLLPEVLWLSAFAFSKSNIISAH